MLLRVVIAFRFSRTVLAIVFYTSSSYVITGLFVFRVCKCTVFRVIPAKIFTKVLSFIDIVLFILYIHCQEQSDVAA
jgi:hypothetical protein